MYGEIFSEAKASSGRLSCEVIGDGDLGSPPALPLRLKSGDKGYSLELLAKKSRRVSSKTAIFWPAVASLSLGWQVRSRTSTGSLPFLLWTNSSTREELTAGDLTV
jgi:hypothetical protein